MSKEYIKDNGRMRLCTSNVAKMNIFEYMWHYRHRMWHNITDAVGELLACWVLVVNVLLIIALPIAYPIMAWKHIRDERKVMVAEHGEGWIAERSRCRRDGEQ